LRHLKEVILFSAIPVNDETGTNFKLDIFSKNIQGETEHVPLIEINQPLTFIVNNHPGL
jgi:hypothetical protein